ncbi:hypothetical protein H6F76_07295 [Leptolyngbya sp. FACHB-321]|uniref:hypothetical protein n=1 Tax=Leptolyngbya sp. FACHB-321 TaxID=2692807 RepID=UPI001688BC96|nr:hypothetical protein [Leptolyngbya sp. FACHB-321]MBD2034839.1 hypothetical protein [Leptolyngbya sp. FACHB-321]
MLGISILTLLLIAGSILFTTAIIYNALHPISKIKQIKRQVVLEFDLVAFMSFHKYSWHNLPLGQLGIVTERFQLDSVSGSYYNLYKAEIIVPVLTDDGELRLHSTSYTVAREPTGIPRLIFLKWLQRSHIKFDPNWYGEKDIYKGSLPVSTKLDSTEEVRYRVAQELRPLIKEHHELQLEIVRVDSERSKAKRLLNLTTKSDVYANQRDRYETVYSEVSGVLAKVKELEQLYRHFIRESLIGVQLATSHPTMLSGSNLSIKAIEAECEKQKEEYQYMKDKVAAYVNLLDAET